MEDSKEPTVIKAEQAARIKTLQTRLSKTEENLEWTEQSAAKWQAEVDKLTEKLEQRDKEINELRYSFGEMQRQYEETHQEVLQLRRKSSVLEISLTASEKQVKTIKEVEDAIEDREQEVRLFTANEEILKAERDDARTEARGLDSDIKKLYADYQLLEDENTNLRNRLAIYEGVLPFGSELSNGQLQDELEGLMLQKTEHDRIRNHKSGARRGANLGDELAGFSDDDDDDNDSEDEDAPSGTLEPVTMRDSEARTDPLGVPPQSIFISSGIQTSPTAASAITTSVDKPFYSRVLKSGVQTSPVAASAPSVSKNEQTFSKIFGSGVQTSPTAASTRPSKVKRPFSQILSSGVQMEPVAASTSPEKKPYSIAQSLGVQTSPVAAVTSDIKHLYSQVVNAGVQTSPVAPSAPVNNGTHSNTSPKENTAAAPQENSTTPSATANTSKKLPLPKFNSTIRRNNSHFNRRIKTPTWWHLPSITEQDSPVVDYIAKFPSRVHYDSWRPLLIHFFVTLLGCLIAITLGLKFCEWPWAHVNGYAPESRMAYTTSQTQWKLLSMIGSFFAFFLPRKLNAGYSQSPLRLG